MVALHRLSSFLVVSFLCLGAAMASGQDSPCDPDAADLRYPDATVGYQKRPGATESYCEGLCTVKISRMIDREIRIDYAQLRAKRPGFDSTNAWTLIWPWLGGSDSLVSRSGTKIHGSSGGSDSQYRLDAECACGDQAECPAEDGSGFDVFQWKTAVLRASEAKFNLRVNDVHFHVKQQFLMGERTEPLEVIIPTILNPQHCSFDRAMTKVSVLVAATDEPLTELTIEVYPTTFRIGTPPAQASRVLLDGRHQPDKLSMSQIRPITIPTAGFEGQVITVDLRYKRKGIDSSDMIHVYIPTTAQLTAMSTHEWPES